MKQRIKMTPLERAKQFAPFAALRGHGEELEKVTRSPVRPPELSEEEAHILNARLLKKRPGDPVCLIYFDGRQIQRLEGRLTLLDEGAKTLCVGRITLPVASLLWIGK